MSEEQKVEQAVKPWVKPSDFLESKNVKVVDGMVLDPAQLGMPEHPTFGALPVLTVLVANDTNTYFVLGSLDCSCGEKRLVHAGDWHQSRACKVCTKRRQRSGGALSEAERLMSQLARAVKDAERKAKIEAAKAAVAVENAANREKARLEQEALVAKVAAEKGVGVSQAS